MQSFDIAPSAMIGAFRNNRALINAMVRREVVGRYRGSVMGIMWSFFNPLLMLAIYTFVFSEVFKARWHEGPSSKAEFALLLFAGLIVFNFFAECVNRAPSLILTNQNYVKKVIFPLEILPLVSLGSALFHAGVSMGVWMLAYVVLYGAPHLTALFLPVIVLPLLLLTAGLSWALASLGVYLRDVSQFVGIATSILMFLSPIFYPITSLPPRYQALMMFNPLSSMVEQVRAVLFWGQYPDVHYLVLCYLGSILIAWLGFAWFQKTRKGFADVI
ncbi:ABC transporter permease [Paraburkholderia sp. A3RO-2L]|uniref:ABC transporter permease n=1 Tax=Paraburkholderia sp. A3RO-2L TaxID=3028376 RepID=UPI003DA8F52E